MTTSPATAPLRKNVRGADERAENIKCKRLKERAREQDEREGEHEKGREGVAVAKEGRKEGEQEEEESRRRAGGGGEREAST